jgi:hypothetical protein
MLLDVYWNILTIHGPINVKSPNNISEWQMGFNSAFKGLILYAGHYAVVNHFKPTGRYTTYTIIHLLYI